MALASQVQKQNLRVKYVHAETFTMHVINAIRQSCMQEFRRSYRNLDVLLIDDVHLLARRTATQEEFFHTFNTLHSDGKQIVIASHSAPSQLDEIEQRLVSRFEWGLVLHLETMDETQKKDFLLARLSQANLIVSNEIASYLVGAFSTLKSLQMAIDALLLRTEAKKIDSLDCIMVCLKDLLENEKKQSLCPDDIIDAVATHFQLKASDLIGKSQTKECAYPRKVAMFLCRKELNLPYLTIGKLFSRDHSTVMTSVKGIEKQIKYQDTDLTHSITTIVTAFSK
jgi:chromosomal replication initiator protein